MFPTRTPSLRPMYFFPSSWEYWLLWFTGVSLIWNCPWLQGTDGTQVYSPPRCGWCRNKKQNETKQNKTKQNKTKHLAPVWNHSKNQSSSRAACRILRLQLWPLLSLPNPSFFTSLQLYLLRSLFGNNLYENPQKLFPENPIQGRD